MLPPLSPTEEDEGPPGLDPKKLGKTYLAFDVDGRVIRTESFSKILAPGFRTGWISAAKPFRDCLSLYMLSSTMGTCSMTAVSAVEKDLSWPSVTSPLKPTLYLSSPRVHRLLSSRVIGTGRGHSSVPICPRRT